jgi:hypothetical protein
VRVVTYSPTTKKKSTPSSIAIIMLGRTVARASGSATTHSRTSITQNQPAWWPVRSVRGRRSSRSPFRPSATATTETPTEAAPPPTTTTTPPPGYRTYTSPLPPLGDKPSELITVKEGVAWSIRQDFPGSGKSGINLNMCLFATSGGLVAYAPIAPTPEVLDLITKVDPNGLAHLIVPNLSPEHGAIHAVGFAEAFPQATVWCPAGLLEGKGLAGAPGGIGGAAKRLATLPNARQLDRQALVEATKGDVDVAIFAEKLGMFVEATLLVRPASAVALADLGFGAFKDEGMVIPPQRWMAQLVGVYERLGAPVAFAVMSSDKAAAQRWASEIQAWAAEACEAGAPEWVFGSHLTPAFPGAKQELERGYAFVPLKF